jgi:hypothetical protein
VIAEVKKSALRGRGGGFWARARAGRGQARRARGAAAGVRVRRGAGPRAPSARGDAHLDCFLSQVRYS